MVEVLLEEEEEWWGEMRVEELRGLREEGPVRFARLSGFPSFLPYTAPPSVSQSLPTTAAAATSLLLLSLVSICQGRCRTVPMFSFSYLLSLLLEELPLRRHRLFILSACLHWTRSMSVLRGLAV